MPARDLPRFFINASLLLVAQRVRRCLQLLPPRLLHEASSQWLFEVDMFDQLEQHPQRTTQPELATVEYLPLLAVAASKLNHPSGRMASVRRCEDFAGRTHLRHMLLGMRSRETSSPLHRLPLVHTCCCVQQRGLYGDGSPSSDMFAFLEQVCVCMYMCM